MILIQDFVLINNFEPSHKFGGTVTRRATIFNKASKEYDFVFITVKPCNSGLQNSGQHLNDQNDLFY